MVIMKIKNKRKIAAQVLIILVQILLNFVYNVYIQIDFSLKMKTRHYQIATTNT